MSESITNIDDELDRILSVYPVVQAETRVKLKTLLANKIKEAELSTHKDFFLSLDFGFWNIGGLQVNVSRNKTGQKTISITIPLDVETQLTNQHKGDE